MQQVIGICSDHAGFEYKTRMIAFLKRNGYKVIDYGTNSAESCDYPDYAHALGRAIASGEVERGIAFCGTGQGMAITLNKHQEARAALCWNPQIAALAREHNNSNVLVMPARFIGLRSAYAITRVWLATEFEGGRHERRVAKIAL